MNFNEFSSWFKPLIVFGTKDIIKVFPEFNFNNLTNWNKAGYIIKLTKGFYTFEEVMRDRAFLFFACNQIVPHSYVSCESAISYYGIGSLEDSITSVSSDTSYLYKSDYGNFKYHLINNPALLSNIRLIKSQGFSFKIATIEKALADYFYFNAKKQTRSEISKLVFYKESIKKQVDPDVLIKISNDYENDSFKERIRNFLKVFYK